MRLVMWARRIFGISKTELNGYIVLIVTMTLLHFGATKFLGKTAASFSQMQYPDSLLQLLARKDSLSQEIIPLSHFDPNTISFDSLILKGLLMHTAKNLISYREAGGTFNKSDDLRKVYGMTDSIWAVLQPWIQIKNPRPLPKIPNTGKADQNQFARSKITSPRNLNQVDSIWFKTIYGIGPVLSQRIVKYRDILGGFVDEIQLYEVYGLSPEVIKRVLERASLDHDSSDIRKLNINQADSQQLARHPYISYQLARAIVAFREQHGSYQSVEELKKIHLIEDSTYLRVIPYLDF